MENKIWIFKILKILDYFDYNAKVTLTMFFISLFVLLIGKLTKGKSTRLFFSTERASLLNPLTYIRFFYSYTWIC